MDTSGVELIGIPEAMQGGLTILIALLAAWLTEPLTAIAKKLGCTTGPTTVAVSAAISLAVSVAASLWAAQAGGEIGLGQALLAALLGFLRANGAYLTRVFAGRKSETLPSTRDIPPEKLGPPAPPYESGPQIREF